jgi:hypothetical protein
LLHFVEDIHKARVATVLSLRPSEFIHCRCRLIHRKESLNSTNYAAHVVEFFIDPIPAK